MSFDLFKRAAPAVLSAALLAACGGGGGDAPAVITPPVQASFALKSGFQARVVSGTSDNFTVAASNGCVGTARISSAAAVPSTFEGVVGVSTAEVTTLNFTNCSPATETTTGTNFYNANYLPIGLSDGGEYAKFEAPPTDIPASVKVGQTGIIATLITYTDSTFNVSTGKRVISYDVMADTDASKAIVKIVTRIYDKVNLLSAETLTYSMAQNGSLTLTLFEVQLSTTSNIRLVLTPTPK